MDQPNTSAPTPAGPASGAPPAPDAKADEPPRKRRGRPFGSTTKTTPLTEQPVDQTPPESAEPQKRRRRTKAIDKDQLAQQLIGLHMMAAKLTGQQFMLLDPAEAKLLADAMENVAREYDLELSGKTGAFIQLLAAGAIVYGPRVLKLKAIREQARREARAAQQPPAKIDSTAGTEPLNGAGAAS
jgi:hypothetical protein